MVDHEWLHTYCAFTKTRNKGCVMRQWFLQSRRPKLTHRRPGGVTSVSEDWSPTTDVPVVLLPCRKFDLQQETSQNCHVRVGRLISNHRRSGSVNSVSEVGSPTTDVPEVLPPISHHAFLGLQVHRHFSGTGSRSETSQRFDPPTTVVMRTSTLQHV